LKGSIGWTGWESLENGGLRGEGRRDTLKGLDSMARNAFIGGQH